MILCSHRAIGAVVYKVPELENDKLLKVSLRSVDGEDTTPISQVSTLAILFCSCMLFNPV